MRIESRKIRNVVEVSPQYEVDASLCAASLAEGDQPQEIVKAFPSLCLHDVHAVMVFAAASAGNDLAQEIGVDGRNV